MSDSYLQKLIIPAGRVKIQVELRVQAGSSAIIIFCQTGSSGQQQLRSRGMATRLEDAGLGTLLPEMFTPEKSRSQGKNYDIGAIVCRGGGPDLVRESLPPSDPSKQESVPA